MTMGEAFRNEVDDEKALVTLQQGLQGSVFVSTELDIWALNFQSTGVILPRPGYGNRHWKRSRTDNDQSSVIATIHSSYTLPKGPSIHHVAQNTVG